jgi:hypothetical protein
MLKAILLAFLAASSAPFALADFVCVDWHKMVMVGMVAGHPITADGEIVDSHAPPGTNEIKPYHSFRIQLLRNDAGDVAIRTVTGHSGAGISPLHEDWTTTLCRVQPRSGTTFHEGDSSGVFSAPQSIPGVFRTNFPFERPSEGKDVEIAVLGTRDFDGIHANGFRCSGELEGKIKEQWLSQELSLEILHIETDPGDHSERRTVIKNIRRIQPDPKFFQPPTLTNTK